MRKVFGSAFALAIFGVSLSAAGINISTAAIGTTGGGQTIYRSTYTLSGISLLLNQELDLRFDANVYSSLFNGVAPGGLYDLALFQPNNPPGAQGDYSLVALVNNPSIAGPFSVEFTLVSGQSLGGSQPYLINQLDSNGNFVSQIASGTAIDPTYVPEPGTFSLAVGGLICAWVVGAAKRRSRQ